MVGAHDLEARIEQIKIMIDAVLIGPDDARRVGFQLLADLALALFKIALFGIELLVTVAHRDRSHIMAALDRFETEQLRFGGIEVATGRRRLHRLNREVGCGAGGIVGRRRTGDQDLLLRCERELRRFG